MKFSYYIIHNFIPYQNNLLPNWHIKSLKLFKLEPIGKSEAKFSIVVFEAIFSTYYAVMNEELTQTPSTEFIVSLTTDIILWQIRIVDL